MTLASDDQPSKKPLTRLTPRSTPVIALFALLAAPLLLAAAPAGQVTLHPDPAMITAIGVGPLTCYFVCQSRGIILRPDGSAAFTNWNDRKELQETAPFKIKPADFQRIAAMIGQLRYDAAPCKPDLTMDPDSRLTWTSAARDTIVLPIPAGCDAKVLAPVTAISDAVWGLAEVKAAVAGAR